MPVEEVEEEVLEENTYTEESTEEAVLANDEVIETIEVVEEENHEEDTNA